MKLVRLLCATLFGIAVSFALSSGLSQTVRAIPVNLFASTDGSGSACTQPVPCSLSMALTQAITDDAVYVAEGIYTGTALFAFAIDRSIRLYGGWDGTTAMPIVRDPFVYPTTLDGEEQRRVIRFDGNISATLDGFIIMHGKGVANVGIAVFLFSWPDARVTIRNNQIISNVATGGWAAGIGIEGGMPLIENNRILSNTTPYEGGGVSAAFDSHPTLKNNLIVGNSAGVAGAGVRLRDVQATLINNTIANNVGVGKEGIYVSTLNALYTLVTLTNNIVVSQSYGLRVESGSAVTLSIDHNDVWGNTTANYSGVSDPTGSAGNISSNPRFVSGLSSHYYLSQIAAGQAVNSPALNTGSAQAATLGLNNRTTRIDRVVDAGIVDMGYHHGLEARMVYLPLVLKN